MEEQKMDVLREEFLLPVSNFTIGSGNHLDGTQKNKRQKVDPQSDISTNVGEFSSQESASITCQDSAESYEPDMDSSRGTLFTTSANIRARVCCLGPQTNESLSRSGPMHPESEQERIATMELQKEKAACRKKEADKIILQSVASSIAKDMEAKKNLQEVRLFCKTHGFTGINVPRRRLNGRKYALHSAVKRCDARIVGLLIRAGADANAIDSRNQTPLQLAKQLHRLGKFDMTTVIAQFLRVDSLDWDSIA